MRVIAVWVVAAAGVVGGALLVPTQPTTARATLGALDSAAANLFSLAALTAPSNLTASAAGSDVGLSWDPGVNGDGYAVEVAGNGPGSDCSSATYVALSSPASTSYTDTGRSTPAGTFFCYRVTTTYGSSWTSVNDNPTVATRVGFVTDSVTMTNAADTSGCSGSGDGAYGTSGALDCGDRITITFNQPVSTASGPGSGDTVCTDVLGVLRVGSTTPSGLCSAVETLHAGSISGGTLGVNARFAAAYTWSNSNRTLTVTLGDRVSGLSFPTISLATWTLTPTSFTSATGSLPICTSDAGGAVCLAATAAPSTL